MSAITSTKHTEPNLRPEPRSGVSAIPPYIPGEAKVEGVSQVIKLASNESPLGPSPRALEALQSSISSAHLYPDANSEELRMALAQKHDVAVDQLVCGCGSEELLHLVARAYVDSGDEVIVSQYGFIGHRIAALAAGGKPVLVPERDYRVDLDAMLAAVTDRTKIVYIANPGNPTGTVLTFAEVEAFHAELPESVLLVLDAAYAEFAEEQKSYRSGFPLVDGNASNVLVTRTFSKMHGLAALRVGWAYGSKEIVTNINRVRPAFNTNALAQAAALAAIDDNEFVERIRRVNGLGLSQLADGLASFGLSVTPSVCNFVLAHFSPDNVITAAEVFEGLRRRGVIVRPVGGYGLPNSLRVSVGTDSQNSILLEALQSIMTAGS